MCKLLEEGIHIPKHGVDAGDHPPMFFSPSTVLVILPRTPMSAASEGALSGDEWKLYDYVVRHFIASVSADCKVTKTKATFSIGDEIFSCSGLNKLFLLNQIP